jgi:hypothetical protein
MSNLTFWQYLRLNKKTTLSCLKICSSVFGGIGTAIFLWFKLTQETEEDPLMVFIVCELFGYGLATFIFILAIIEGYTKAKLTIGQFNRIPHRVKTDLSLELVRKPLNPKYWFMQFEIVQKINEEYYQLDEQTRKKVIG